MLRLCCSSVSSRHFLKASPLRNNQELLTAWLPIKTCTPNTAWLHDVVKVFSSTRLPGFTGLDFLTTTGSSATSHCVARFLESPLGTRLPTRSFRCVRRTVPGFPSYCAGSLLTIPSSNTLGVCLCIGLRAILHTYPHRAPNQVHFRYVPSTSYRFLQTSSLANDALAIRILFPTNRVRSRTSRDRVCQLRWANIE